MFAKIRMSLNISEQPVTESHQEASTNLTKAASTKCMWFRIVTYDSKQPGSI